MLVELRVRDLGVIEDATLLLGPGLTALTGETGAGKTLIVGALGLLLGGRAESLLVRPGASEAVVEGRFEASAGAEERILARAVAAGGRSRAYVDGRMASVAELSAAGEGLLDLHGQHAYQALLSPASQRDALDRAGRVDAPRLAEARRRVRELDEHQAQLGGDERARAREVDLLRFQLGEIDAARISDAGEDEALRAEEERLADAVAHREALQAAYQALTADGGATDGLGAGLAAVAGRRGLDAVHDRLRSLAVEAADAADEVRHLAEAAEEDPERLAAVGARRQLLGDLRRKYGETLGDVLAFREEAAARLTELDSREAATAALAVSRAEAEAQLAVAAAEVGAARRAAAGAFAGAVEERLRMLALPRASFSVEVSDDPAGETVTWMLGANPGEPALPLRKVASGGELARTMLAVRLALLDAGPARVESQGLRGPGREDSQGLRGPGREDSQGLRGPGRGVSPGFGDGPRTLVFDEVDAGVGGEAAVAVGTALAEVARWHQVVVVTHLPQVAAFADRQVVVVKDGSGERTVARVRVVDGEERVAELARMLSGRPDSDTARRHAAELLSAGPAGSRGGRPLPSTARRHAAGRVTGSRRADQGG